MSPEIDSEVAFRLRSARGHLDGVIRMVEENRSHLEVLHQLSAVQGALERVRRSLLEVHVRGCVREAVSEGGTGDVVDQLLAAVFGSPSPSLMGMRRSHPDEVASGAGP